MKVVLFGATGMVGQGVLRECLCDPNIDSVLYLGRTPVADSHAKLQQLVHSDFQDFSSLEGRLIDFDACFFCLGVSAAGMSEENYAHFTYDIAMAAATTLARLNPEMTFIYTSGTGADSTERGKIMWARVKGKTENALLRLPFKAAYMFRPGLIQPLHGIRSKTRFYRIFYAIGKPLIPILRAVAPQHVTTTEKLGRAMIKVARQGYIKPIIESTEINQIAG